jgi:hypothetical protein
MDILWRQLVVMGAPRTGTSQRVVGNRRAASDKHKGQSIAQCCTQTKHILHDEVNGFFSGSLYDVCS